MKVKNIYKNFATKFFSYSLLSLWAVSAFAAENYQDTVTISTPQQLIEESAKVKTEFQENVHYKVIPGAELSPKKEVREFFSFFCGHCFQFLPIITRIEQALPEDAYFVGNPVHYLGGSMGMMTVKAYATAVSLQIAEPFTQLLTHKIFEENKIPQSEDDLMKVFEELGIPNEKIKAQFNSFPVNTMATQYTQLTADKKISGVPSVVINGKYLIVASSVSGEPEYFALVQYLLSKDNDKYKK